MLHKSMKVTGEGQGLLVGLEPRGHGRQCRRGWKRPERPDHSGV